MCRKFDCGVLIRTQSGELEVSEALQIIRLARRRRNDVRRQLEQFGFWQPDEPISDGYQRAFASPWDLSEGEDALKQREKLHLSLSRLEALLNSEFLLES